MSGGVLTGTEDRPCDKWPSTISKRLSLLSTHTCLPQSPAAPATTNARLSRLGAPSLVSVNLADNRLHTLKALVPLSRLPQLSRLALEDEGLVFWLVIGFRATKRGGGRVVNARFHILADRLRVESGLLPSQRRSNHPRAGAWYVLQRCWIVAFLCCSNRGGGRN